MTVLYKMAINIIRMEADTIYTFYIYIPDFRSCSRSGGLSVGGELSPAFSTQFSAIRWCVNMRGMWLRIYSRYLVSVTRPTVLVKRFETLQVF